MGYNGNNRRMNSGYRGISKSSMRRGRNIINGSCSLLFGSAAAIFNTIGNNTSYPKGNNEEYILFDIKHERLKSIIRQSIIGLSIATVALLIYYIFDVWMFVSYAVACVGFGMVVFNLDPTFNVCRQNYKIAQVKSKYKLSFSLLGLGISGTPIWIESYKLCIGKGGWCDWSIFTFILMFLMVYIFAVLTYRNLMCVLYINKKMYNK